jgi:hypothetical protein
MTVRAHVSPLSGPAAAPPRRQLTAQQHTHADEEGHADDERGRERRKILQHAATVPGPLPLPAGQ